LPVWGNLRSTSPFSNEYGFDRGTPIDRYYLHRFLQQHRTEITGNVLEVQGSGYTRQFGQGVMRADSFDINPRFQPTYVCDLAKAESILPSNRYDCCLLPNTLQHLRELEACLRNALRVGKPGGVILASSAVFEPLISDGADYWRLSSMGWEEITARVWAGCEVKIEAHGNCLAVLAAMLGLASEELTPEELDLQSWRYPVLVTFSCRKQTDESFD
jgi:SAM-dependent methyltransferase